MRKMHPDKVIGNIILPIKSVGINYQSLKRLRLALGISGSPSG